MAKQTVNIGTTANDRTGDNLRTAFNKINENFSELYTALGLDEAPLNLGAFEFTGSTITTTDSTTVIIDQATTVTSDLTVGGDISGTVSYSPSTDAHWTDPNPTTVAAALDRLAAAIYAANGGSSI